MITKTMDSLRQIARFEPVHQADLVRREEAFAKDLRLDGQRIRILRRPVAGEATTSNPEDNEGPAQQLPEPVSRSPLAPPEVLFCEPGLGNRTPY